MSKEKRYHHRRKFLQSVCLISHQYFRLTAIKKHSGILPSSSD